MADGGGGGGSGGDFGSGLGTLIGAEIGANDLSNSQDAVNSNANNFMGMTSNYNSFGQAFLPATSGAIEKAAEFTNGTQDYNTFMKNYQASPGAQYAIQQGQEAQNESAASTGQLLSGANQRALSGITQNIANQYANTAYQNYLAGNNQQFGQLESLIGNAFSGIGVGQTATGQDAGVINGQNSATAALGQAQAKNDQGKGSGLGSMFSGLTKAAVMF